MSSSSNDPPIVTIDSQLTNASATATGSNIQPEMTENQLRPYNTSRNYSNFLSSISLDDENYIKILLVMLHPLNDDIQKKIDNLIDKKVLSKSGIRTTKVEFKAEVKRWADFMNVDPKSDSWRKPRCLKYLEENQLIPSELSFVTRTLESYFNRKENEAKEAQETAMRNEILNKVNRKKFRIYHAIFNDSLRRSLVSLYVSKERRDQIDAQNTVADSPDFFPRSLQPL